MLPPLERRAFLKHTAGLGALASIVTLGGACSQQVPPRPASFRLFSDAQAYTLTNLIDALLPGEGGLPAGNDLGLALAVDNSLAEASEPLRSKFCDALLFLEWATQFGMDLKPFSRLDRARRQQVFAAFGTSRWGVKRALYGGLKGVIMFAYADHPDTWSGLGYDGPWVGRFAAPATAVTTP